jgi:hypothetical protein
MGKVLPSRVTVILILGPIRSKAGELAKLAGAKEHWTATQKQKNTEMRRFLTMLQDSKIRFAFRVMSVPIRYKFAR